MLRLLLSKQAKLLCNIRQPSIIFEDQVSDALCIGHLGSIKNKSFIKQGESREKHFKP